MGDRQNMDTAPLRVTAPSRLPGERISAAGLDAIAAGVRQQIAAERRMTTEAELVVTKATMVDASTVAVEVLDPAEGILETKFVDTVVAPRPRRASSGEVNAMLQESVDAGARISSVGDGTPPDRPSSSPAHTNSGQTSHGVDQLLPPASSEGPLESTPPVHTAGSPFVGRTSPGSADGVRYETALAPPRGPSGHSPPFAIPPRQGSLSSDTSQYHHYGQFAQQYQQFSPSQQYLPFGAHDSPYYRPPPGSDPNLPLYPQMGAHATNSWSADLRFAHPPPASLSASQPPSSPYSYGGPNAVRSSSSLEDHSSRRPPPMFYGSDGSPATSQEQLVLSTPHSRTGTHASSSSNVVPMSTFAPQPFLHQTGVDPQTGYPIYQQAFFHQAGYHPAYITHEPHAAAQQLSLTAPNSPYQSYDAFSTFSGASSNQSFPQGPPQNYGQYHHQPYPHQPSRPYQSNNQQRPPRNSHYRPVSFAPQQLPSFDPTAPPPPRPYSPPPEAGLARGMLAQAKLHDAVYDREAGQYASTPPDRRKGGGRSALPRPPSHSPHALWVGNVPADSTHAELWRFFTLRPAPASNPRYNSLNAEDLPEGIDLDDTGVESIHLIVRSNCAFVNYQSDIHLQHAIEVSHGAALRPFDPRCKDLVCRVRKRDDDTKSGVGAQRVGGMHRDYIARKVEEGAVSPRSDASRNGAGHTHRHSTSSTTHSASTTSTSSSFFGRYFPKRYFVLKSHNEDDLRLSVERGLWATQSHNEPVLDQAFRSCKDGVYLFFSANKSGEWFGFAKMVSAISTSQERHFSWSTSSNSNLSSGSNPKAVSRPATIQEEEASTFPQRPSMLFSPSEERLADASPGPLTPGGVTSLRERGESAPPQLAPHTWQLSGAPSSTDVSPRGASLDPRILASVRGLTVSDQPTIDQALVGAASGDGELDEDGILRKDTLPSAEERNARLEKIDDATTQEGKPLAAGWGKPFEVEWVCTTRLPFIRTRHITNPFNGNREVKISRDGTEVEPAAGEALIAEFWRDHMGAATARHDRPLSDMVYNSN